MVMLTLDHCWRIARGQPDPSSGEFRSAVAAVAAWTRNAVEPEKRQGLLDLQSALLAHGEPVQPRKPSKAELSAIRREASSRGLVARARGSLVRKMDASRSGLVGVSEKKPAVFDAALELIEDGEAHCVHYATDVSPDGAIRRLSITTAKVPVPPNTLIRECPWKSVRQQKENLI